MRRRRLLAALFFSVLGVAAAETRTYHSLWDGLFKQQYQADNAMSAQAPTGLHAALAELQGRLMSRLAGGGGSASFSDDVNNSDVPASDSGLAHRSALSSVDSYFAEKLNASLALLSAGSVGAGASTLASHLPHLHSAFLPAPPNASWSAADVQELAVQAWALGALAGGSSAAASGLALHAAASGGASTASSLAGDALGSALAQPVANPAWAAFQGVACMRLQNFGNADGYNAALLGPLPCSAATPGTAAASADLLRWQGSTSFLLDCSKGGGSDTAGTGSGSGAGQLGDAALESSSEPSGLLSGMLSEAGKTVSKVAASVVAAMDRRRTCRLALSTGGAGASAGAGTGSGAQLEHTFERPLLGAPQMDALRLRICNLPPAIMQYPAALARGTTVTLSGLKLNGRPLLRGDVMAPQAAAADGCLLQLFRLPGSSKASKAGSFVLSGWVALSEGGTSSSTGAGTAGSFPAGSLFGVGEMASLEIALGEYSRHDAAASRLLSTTAGNPSAAAAGAAPLP